MTRTIEGTYGSGRTPCDIFIYEENGGCWYAADGSLNVNFTHDELPDGVNIETLQDFDFFTAGRPIDSEETLAEQVEA